MGRFNEIKIGDRAELKHIITKSDIEKFVELTGDNNKLHVDESYASKTSFRKPVVHGMLGASFISTIIGTKLPGDGALWFAQSLEFLLPVRVGDEITVRVEVTAKVESEKVIELRTDIFNEHKQKVTTGTAKVKVIEQEARKGEKETPGIKKTALVIGGSGGIGKQTCLQLARDGFDVAIHFCTNKQRAELIQGEITKIGRQAFVVGADITNEYQVNGMIEGIIRQFEVISVVVNCSSTKIPAVRFTDLEWQDVQKHIDVNLKGFFRVLKHLVPLMEKQKYGKIITVISQAVETPSVGWLHYITAKAALSGFSKALAMELAPKGIRVNMVSPGMTETELIADISEKTKLMIEAKTPLRRIATPEDVANAIAFLASPKADFLAGETIRVNGGQVMI